MTNSRSLLLIQSALAKLDGVELSNEQPLKMVMEKQKNIAHLIDITRLLIVFMGKSK